MKYPKALEQLIASFASYPGIGQKTAERLAIYSLSHMQTEQLEAFKEALTAIKTDITSCEVCGNIAEGSRCDICNNMGRDHRTIMVVEDIKDVIVIERMHEYSGVYHVLNGVVNFSKGIGIEDINFESLKPRLKEVDEVILATNATVEGEITAKYIKTILEDENIKITRIAHGLPVGGDLQYADDMTLLKALEGRRTF